MSNEKPLSNEEKEQFAFRVEALTFLCAATHLLHDVNLRLADIHEELSQKEQDAEADLGEYTIKNRKLFAEYLSQARNLTDESGAFFKELQSLRDKL